MRVMRGLWAGLAAVLPLAIPLFVATALMPDGQALWPRALALMGGAAVIAVFANIAMALRRPDNLAMRRTGPVAGPTRKQPLVDAVGLVAFIGYLVAWFGFIPWDVGRLHLLPTPPAWAMAAGLAAAMLGNAVSHLAVWQNAFAAPTIHEQDGQRVIDTGLYGVVRHPLYAGNLLFFAGAALWLGSLAALVGVGVILLATIARVLIEERYLREHLAGYADYARRVRARLVPYVI